MSYFEDFMEIAKSLGLDNRIEHIIQQNDNFRDTNFRIKKSKKELENRKKQKKKKKAIKKLRRKLKNRNK